MNKACRVSRSRIARLLKVKRIEDVTTEEYVHRLRKFSEDVIDREEAEAAAKIFSAVSDPIRISILKLLSRRRRMCVCELMIALGLSQPAVSYHPVSYTHLTLPTH